MEEEKKEEQQDQQNQQEQQGMPGRSVGLMLLAGAYLVYTGYQLCANVLSGEDGATWGFMAAGVAFLVIGAGMLFVSGKNLLKKNQAKKAAEEKERELNPPPEPEPAQKAMSIAERARLAGNVAEKEAEEAEKTEAEKASGQSGDQES